jgi:thiol-disulfide isomerase/thioredoxin
VFCPPRFPCPSRLSRRAVGLAVTAAALAVAGCSGGPTGQYTAERSGQDLAGGSGITIYQAPALAPAIFGNTLAGGHLSLASYRGSVTVLNFWASWCGPCRAEAPGFAALAARSRSAGVRFLGIDIQDQAASALAFARTFRIVYPSLSDPGGDIALAFRSTIPPAAIPTTLIINRAGRITARIIGGASYIELRTLISRAGGHA